MLPARDRSPFSQSARRYTWSLIALGLFTHALLLLNDGIFLDDWFIWLQVFENDWAGFRTFWADLGHQHLIPFYEFLYRHTPALLAQSTIQLASLILTALSLFIIFTRNLGVPPLESWFASAFTLTYPFFWISVHHLTMHYVMGMGLFCLGWALHLNWKGARRVWRDAIVFLLLGLAMYTYNSLLAFYFGFVLIAWYDCHLRNPEAKWHATIRPFVRERWFMLIFPFLVYALKRVLSPPGGTQENYNELIILTQSPWEAVGTFFYILEKNLTNTIREIGRIVRQFLFPWLGLLLLAGMGATWWACRSRTETANGGGTRYRWLNWKLVIIATVLLVLSIVPYAMVGKIVYPEWGYRHTFVMSIPLGLAAVLLISGLAKAVSKLPPWFGAVTLSGLLMLMTAAGIYKYNQALVRWTIDRAIAAALKTHAPPEAGTFLFFETPLYPSKDVYRRYELAGLLYLAWGDLKWYPVHDRTALDENLIAHHLEWTRDLNTRYLWHAWGIAPKARITGCIAVLRVLPKDNENSPWLGLQYVLIRMFAKDRLPSFLNRILEVEIETVPYKECAAHQPASGKAFTAGP